MEIEESSQQKLCVQQQSSEGADEADVEGGNGCSGGESRGVLTILTPPNTDEKKEGEDDTMSDDNIHTNATEDDSNNRTSYNGPLSSP